MTGIVAHTYPEWWLKLAGQVAHWSTDYSFAFAIILHNNKLTLFAKSDKIKKDVYVGKTIER